MSRSSNLFLMLGAAAGAAWAANQALRRQRAARWQTQTQQVDRKVALVTGASSGIGAEYARQLASQGYSLVLVARRQARLDEQAAELRQQYNVYVEVLPADLADPQGLAGVEARLARGDVDFLVNNAGFGQPGDFVEIPAGQNEAMLRVHILASVRLTQAALPAMLERGRGAIVNLSSVAAFVSSPGDATYGPSKLYINRFTEDLALVMARRGIRMQALCPGFTHTGFHSTPAYEGLNAYAGVPKWLWLTPETVVAESLRSIANGDVFCVPYWPYKIAAFLGTSGIAQAFMKVGAAINPEAIRRIRGHASRPEPRA